MLGCESPPNVLQRTLDDRERGQGEETEERQREERRRGEERREGYREGSRNTFSIFGNWMVRLSFSVLQREILMVLEVGTPGLQQAVANLESHTKKKKKRRQKEKDKKEKIKDGCDYSIP